MTAPKPILISERQYDVLACMAEGLSNKSIARRLGISFRMVLTEAQNIYRKLGIVGSGTSSRVYASLAFEREQVAIDPTLRNIARPVQSGQSGASLTANTPLTSAPSPASAHAPADSVPPSAVGRVSHQ